MSLMRNLSSDLFEKCMSGITWLLFSLFYSIFINFLSKVKNWGHVTVRIADEPGIKVFGNDKTEHKAHLEIKDLSSFLWKSITQADIGFAESFIEGDFDCDDLTTLLMIFQSNRENMNGLDTKSAWFGHILNRMSHLRRANTIAGSKKNIEEHYDLGNEMFQIFLDKTLTYSCAFWENPSETLEQAQHNKLRMMVRKAGIQSEDHVLEIGSGWGSFSIEAVKLTGCRVTTITLSSQQKELAEERIKAEGLEDKIEVKLIDYRDIQGQYDKIISIEMLEAVGHENLPVYFGACSRLLKPGGKMVFQVITSPNKNYDNYRRECDFIQKHIFPGGLCPSVSAILDAIEKSSDLVVENMHNIGIHYARTLKEWRETFIANKESIMACTGFDETFIRKWIYYFCYCEAGFATNYLGVYQIELLSRPF